MALSQPSAIQWRPHRTERRRHVRDNVLFGITLAVIATGVPAAPQAADDPRLAVLQTSEYKHLIGILNGDVSYGAAIGLNLFAPPQAMPMLTTPGYKAWEGRAQYPIKSYRFISVADPSTQVETPERKYVRVLAIPGRDVVVLARMSQLEWTFSLFDIAANEETTLLHLLADGHGIPMTLRRHYLVLGVGHDLIVYDLEQGLVVRYEKDLISEGIEPWCPGCTDRNRIAGFLLDRDRLFVMPENSENVRIIELPVYASSFSDGEFFFGALNQRPCSARHARGPGQASTGRGLPAAR